MLSHLLGMKIVREEKSKRESDVVGDVIHKEERYKGRGVKVTRNKGANKIIAFCEKWATKNVFFSTRR